MKIRATVGGAANYRVILVVSVHDVDRAQLEPGSTIEIEVPDPQKSPGERLWELHAKNIDELFGPASCLPWRDCNPKNHEAGEVTIPPGAKNAFAICSMLVSGYSGIPAGLMSDVCDQIEYQLDQRTVAYERGKAEAPIVANPLGEAEAVWPTLTDEQRAEIGGRP